MCGNKVDLEAERKITTKDGEKAAEKLGIPFMETSAKTGNNVVEAYHELVRNIPRSGIEYKVSKSVLFLNVQLTSLVFRHILSQN